MSLQMDHDLPGRDPDLHLSAGQARRDRVVHVSHPDEAVLLDPDLRPEIDVGKWIRKGVQVPPLRGQGLPDPAPHPAVVAAVRDVGRPGVGLGLQVIEVREGSQRQERALQVPVGPLDLALGLRLAGIEHDEPQSKVAAQGRHFRV